jgi:hypothetical protein
MAQGCPDGDVPARPAIEAGPATTGKLVGAGMGARHEAVNRSVRTFTWSPRKGQANPDCAATIRAFRTDCPSTMTTSQCCDVTGRAAILSPLPTGSAHSPPERSLIAAERSDIANRQRLALRR